MKTILSLETYLLATEWADLLFADQAPAIDAVPNGRTDGISVAV